MVHASSTMWRIKNRSSNFTSCNDNALRLMVLVVRKLYWGLQVTSSFSNLGLYFAGLFWESDILKGQIAFERHWRLQSWTLLRRQCPHALGREASDVDNFLYKPASRFWSLHSPGTNEIWLINFRMNNAWWTDYIEDFKWRPHFQFGVMFWRAVLERYILKGSEDFNLEHWQSCFVFHRHWQHRIEKVWWPWDSGGSRGPGCTN